MKKLTISIIAFLFLSGAAYGITPSHENKLLMNAMVEGATTPTQKVAVSKYLNMIAKEKLKQADSYRRLANRNFAGKAMKQRILSKEYTRKANALESEAKNYQQLAGRNSGTLASN
jgi:hypothetical protein